MFDFTLRRVVLATRGDLISQSCVVDAVPMDALRVIACRELAEGLMREAIANGENISPKDRAANRADKWLHAKQPEAGKYTEGEFATAVAQLKTAGKIRVEPYGN